MLKRVIPPSRHLPPLLFLVGLAVAPAAAAQDSADVDVDKSDWRGRVKSSQNGPFLSVSFSW